MRDEVTRGTSWRRRMVRAAAMSVAMVPIVVVIASAHDMFVKPERFRVAENATVLIRLLNGTFSKSENSIARTRIIDISVVSPAGRARVDTADWGVAGDTSTMQLRTTVAGTYVIGVSTRPNVIGMKGSDFAQYLRDDGIPDELARRRQEGVLADSVRERYAKHVKALLQVGSVTDSGFATVLGYPAELVPLENPYARRGRAPLRFRVLVDGKPVANQYVQYGGRTPSGARIPQRGVRSNAEGIVSIPLQGKGHRFVKFISMVRTTGDAEASHESRWATLTYDVR